MTGLLLWLPPRTLGPARTQAIELLHARVTLAHSELESSSRKFVLDVRQTRLSTATSLNQLTFSNLNEISNDPPPRAFTRILVA